jgi:hypothetical protein
MPIYQNSTPPYALSSGDVGFSFNNEAFPAANTAGSQFALPSYTGISDGGSYGSRSDFDRSGDSSGFSSGAPRAGQAPPQQSGPRFVTGMPLAEQIARQVSATDPTSQAIHYQRLEAEARRQFRPQKFPGRRHW